MYKYVIASFLILSVASYAVADDETAKKDAEYKHQLEVIAAAKKKQQEDEAARLKAAQQAADDKKRDKALDDLVKSVPKQ
jgi:F0F1-type ATP synthase membrane subunit b/b'